jgi:hypothetical protein
MPINRHYGELHLARKWNRLLETRRALSQDEGSPPSLSEDSPEYFRESCPGVSRGAVKWSLVTINPVPLSEPPVPRRKNGLALTPAKLRLAS